MEDDTIMDATGLALGSVTIAIQPLADTPNINAIASNIREQLKDDLFEDGHVFVLPARRLAN
jgi:hypothetical protein